MNVTRAVLPVMRKQRSGLIISISSTAGLAGFEFGTAYAASKFGLEGWMESLAPEVAPFGITTTIVNPGFFRTELLTEQSAVPRSSSRRTTCGRSRRPPQTSRCKGLGTPHTCSSGSVANRRSYCHSFRAE
jgi:NAD(P)-dependent dehydrogenase (short-subunit alcohol dehydrogenase family)